MQCRISRLKASVKRGAASEGRGDEDGNNAWHAHHGFACDPRTVTSCESFDDDALLTQGINGLVSFSPYGMYRSSLRFYLSSASTVR